MVLEHLLKRWNSSGWLRVGDVLGWGTQSQCPTLQGWGHLMFLITFGEILEKKPWKDCEESEFLFWIKGLTAVQHLFRSTHGVGKFKISPKAWTPNPHEKMSVIVNVLTRLVNLSPLSAACEKPKADSIPSQISSQGRFLPKTDFIPRQTSSQKRFHLKTDFISRQTSSQERFHPRTRLLLSSSPLAVSAHCPFPQFPAHGWVGTGWILRFFPSQTSQWFLRNLLEEG